MPTLKVEVKWGKESFKDVEIDLDQPPLMFKTQLFSLTGVPPERQKIMGVKGGLLKDDADWGKLGLKPGQKLTMMGTADTLPEAPKQPQTFMEDLPEEEQDTSGARSEARRGRGPQAGTAGEGRGGRPPASGSGGSSPGPTGSAARYTARCLFVYSSIAAGWHHWKPRCPFRPPPLCPARPQA